MDKLSFGVGIPEGTSISVLGSIRHKKLVNDLLKRLQLVKQRTFANPAARIKAQKEEMKKFLMAFNANGNPADLENFLIQNGYTNCGTSTGAQGSAADIPLENGGHMFGTDIPDADKEALINFLITI
jgi:hypothetical protein